MVGVGTVLKDNPALTVRRAAGRSPARIVLDSTVRTPLDSQVLRGGGPPTLLATTDRARPDAIQSLAEKGAELLVVPENSGRQVDLEVLLDQLQQRGLRSILVEGGATLITNMLRANLVDRLVVCIAPKILGTGIEAVGELDIRDLSRALTFTRSSFMACDEDVIFDGLMRQGEAAEQ